MSTQKTQTKGASFISDPQSPQYSAGNTNSLRERIARRAYELYLARGGEHGHDQEDWLRAEHELQSHSGVRA